MFQYWRKISIVTLSSPTPSGVLLCLKPFKYPKRITALVFARAHWRRKWGKGTLTPLDF